MKEDLTKLHAIFHPVQLACGEPCTSVLDTETEMGSKMDLQCQERLLNMLG